MSRTRCSFTATAVNPRMLEADSEAMANPRTLRTDHLDPVARSALMRRVKRTGTAPEMVVRSAAHRMGFRFRVNRADFAGRPDLVFPRYRSVIFVHGCFWHRHLGCRKASVPATRPDYWAAKFARNVKRDAAAMRAIRQRGWRVLIIWECQVADKIRLAKRIRRFLGSNGPPRSRLSGGE